MQEEENVCENQDSLNLRLNMRQMKRIDTEFLSKKNPFGIDFNQNKLYKTMEFPSHFKCPPLIQSNESNSSEEDVESFSGACKSIIKNPSGSLNSEQFQSQSKFQFGSKTPSRFQLQNQINHNRLSSEIQNNCTQESSHEENEIQKTLIKPQSIHSTRKTNFSRAISKKELPTPEPKNKGKSYVKYFFVWIYVKKFVQNLFERTDSVRFKNLTGEQMNLLGDKAYGVDIQKSKRNSNLKTPAPFEMAKRLFYYQLHPKELEIIKKNNFMTIILESISSFNFYNVLQQNHE